MQLNRSLTCKALHTLPVLPVYMIIITVIFSYTYFFTLEQAPMIFPKLVSCILFYFLATMTIICHTIAMITDPGTSNHRLSHLIKDDNLKRLYSKETLDKLNLIEEEFVVFRKKKELEMKKNNNNNENNKTIIAQNPKSPDYIKFNHPLICSKCLIKRPERAHHCKHCNKCVLKMDHHCPWIANCVGFYNQKSFILFLFYATIGNLVAFIGLGMKAYYSLMALLYNPRIFMKGKHINNAYSAFWKFFYIFWEPFAVFIGAMLALAMVIAIGMLFIHQIRMTGSNSTGIELYEFDSDEKNPWFIKNRKVFCWSFIFGVEGSILDWFIPVFKSNIYNNGYSYYVPDRSDKNILEKDKNYVENNDSKHGGNIKDFTTCKEGSFSGISDFDDSCYGNKIKDNDKKSKKKKKLN